MTWTLTPELEDAILSRIEEGESMRQICSDEGMPSRRTVLRWLRENNSFATKCARARDEQADFTFDRHQDIIEDMFAGTIQTDQARVALSALQWRAAKLAPKKYGDKQTIDHEGSISVVTKEQRDAAVAAALAADS